MIETHFLTSADTQKQPWKNGGGETLQIAVDDSVPFRWRVSKAPLIQSGDFSLFGGYDRSLVLLQGGPVTLQLDGKKQRRLREMDVVTFKGDWRVFAKVEAPAEDFNLFTLQGKARGACYPTYLRADEQTQLPLAGQEHFVYCVSGGVQLFDPNSDRRQVLAPGETWRVRRTSAKEFLNLRGKGQAGGARLLWVVIHTSLEPEAV